MYFLTLLTSILPFASLTTADFYLKSRPVSDLPIHGDHSLFLTRYGYLTASKEDADLFTISEDEELTTFPTSHRTQKMGILLNTTNPTNALNVLPPPRTSSLHKITTRFSAKETYYGMTLFFENDAFNNSMHLAGFVVPLKTTNGERGLDGARVQVVTTYKGFKWEEWLVLDLLVVEEGEGTGEL